MEEKRKDHVPMNKFHLIFLIYILSAVLLTGCAKSNPKASSPDTAAASEQDDSASNQETAASKPKEPDAGIVFEARDIEGNTVTSSIFSGSKLTMVNIWATYCNPCLMEMPELGELAGEYDDDTFQLIGVISDVLEGADQRTTRQAEELISQTGAAYPHLLLNESLYLAFLQNVTAVPTTFFIDENGAVLDIVVGAMEKEAWEKKIDELLGEN